jgi:hypothetical protein
VAAVLLLSMPSAVGVARALEPTRGLLAAVAAAVGFELTYLSLSLLRLRPRLRSQARTVALGAVLSAITLNVLADYATRVPGGLASWPTALRLFDPLGLILSLIESAPLAGLAYALASLLHRLAEDEEAAPAEARAATEEAGTPEAQASPAPALGGLPALALTHLSAAGQGLAQAATYRCRHCGTEELTKVEQLAHGRRHAAERRAAIAQ